MAAFTVARDNVPAALTGGAVVIGNFDGLHRGHQALARNAIARARSRGGPSVALTFDPHPRAWFHKQGPFFALSPIGVKETLMRAAGLDGVAIKRFDAAFASQSAETFFTDVVHRQFRPHTVVVGHDFRFGEERKGDETLLRQLAEQVGVDVAVVEPQTDSGEGGETLYSSSAIRAALAGGDCARAAEFLGYRWFMRGNVEHGEKRGRDLGYPTANMRPAPGCGLRHGVYAVLGRIGERIVPGVANFGIRPQFELEAPLLETFFFDFRGDLYGRSIDIAPVAFLRGEARFDGLDPLIAQMDEDSRRARAVLGEISRHDPIADLALAKGLNRLGAGAHGAFLEGAHGAFLEGTHGAFVQGAHGALPEEDALDGAPAS